MRGVFRVLPREISPVLQKIEAGHLKTDAEHRGEVSRLGGPSSYNPLIAIQIALAGESHLQ